MHILSDRVYKSSQIFYQKYLRYNTEHKYENYIINIK